MPLRSDHCPAMKGIETTPLTSLQQIIEIGSDHCPAMKGIETSRLGDNPGNENGR